MPSLRSSSGCGPTSNSYPALSRLFVEHIDPCCNDCDLTIGDNNIVVNTKDNRVGINTSIPVEALDVNGNIYTSGDVSAQTASFYGDSTPGSTTLNVTGNAGFYGDITSISEITAGTKLFSRGAIESTGETKVGSLKVLGVSNFDGSVNVPAGTITAGGNITTSATISAATASFSTSATLVSRPIKTGIKYTPISVVTGNTYPQNINNTLDTFSIYFINIRLGDATTTPNIQLVNSTATVNSGYVGVTKGPSLAVNHSNAVLLTTSQATNTNYTGVLNFEYMLSGTTIYYFYYGKTFDGVNFVDVQGYVSYASSSGKAITIRFNSSAFTTGTPAPLMYVVGSSSS